MKIFIAFIGRAEPLAELYEGLGPTRAEEPTLHLELDMPASAAVR